MPAYKDDLMTVGELARRVGVTVRTIQYYDQKGLLHPSSKSEQNQRLYSTDDEERLYRILTLKFLGFSLAQIKEAEGIDDCQKLSGALDHRMCELERESMEILRNINTISDLKEHLAASESVRWSDFAQAISDMQNREDVLWMAINREGCDESSVPELTHEAVDRWHEQAWHATHSHLRKAFHSKCAADPSALPSIIMLSEARSAESKHLAATQRWLAS